MPEVTTKDGTRSSTRTGASGSPVVFSHGWPLNADVWDPQLLFMASNGFRAVAHDRRGHGRSSQPWDGNTMDDYADDLAAVIETLDLRDVVLVGSLHRRRRSRAVHRPPRLGTRRQGRARRGDPAADAADGGQPATAPRSRCSTTCGPRCSPTARSSSPT